MFIIDWIKQLVQNFKSTKKNVLIDAGDFESIEKLNQQDTLEQTKFIWCLVGNIIERYYSSEEKLFQYGTKHFSPKTRVYCLPAKWDDGYENIKVIGKHRKSFRMVCVVMPSKPLLIGVYRKFFIHIY